MPRSLPPRRRISSTPATSRVIVDSPGSGSAPPTLSSGRYRHESRRPPTPLRMPDNRGGAGHSGDPFFSSPSLPRLPRSRQATPNHLNPSISSRDDTDQDSDALAEAIMAVEMKDNGCIGCAYYVAAEECLYLLDDVLQGGLDIVGLVLVHAQPTTVITTTRANTELLSHLNRGASQPVDASDGNPRGAYILRQIGSGEFSYDSAIQRLLSIAPVRNNSESAALPSIVEDNHGSLDASFIDEDGVLLNLGTLINMGSVISVGCAGAVLGDLQRRRAAQRLPRDADELASFVVKKLKMFSLADFMFVNADTLAALQIVGSEAHPNKYSEGAKENLSLFGLFNFHAVTHQGKSKLRQMFLRPSIDLTTIHERQRTLLVFLRLENTEIITAIHKGLRKIRNMRTTMINLRKGIESSSGGVSSVKNSVWGSLQRFSSAFLELFDHFQRLAGRERLHLLPQILSNVPRDSVVQVGEMIGRTVDFKQSQERLRTAVSQGVDPDLDALKREYDGMEAMLTEVATNINQEIPQWAQAYVQNCIFFPQIGFLTVVALDPETGKGKYEGEGSRDPAWQLLFTTDGNVYYKNQRMKELDDRFGDMYCAILDREIELLHDLAVQVIEHEEAIIAASDACGELDSLLALALGARLYKWNAPCVVDEKIIKIKDGRHALLERVVPSFIPNDCEIGQRARAESRTTSSVTPQHQLQSPSILVLTGPNHSGKSVYLKQVALIVYLAHIGSHVPAASAVIGLTDRLLTRIATRESVGRDESAFAIDLKQAAFSISFATGRSLILVDEFGKGTGPTDGAGLLTGLLQHFHGLGSETPRVLAATHFHEVFENGFVEAGPKLGLAHMEVRLDLGEDSEEDEVTYLYRLRSGRNASSFGSWCARVNGVDNLAVDRAEAIVLLLARNEDLACVSARLTERQAEALRESEEVARRFLEIEFGEYDDGGLGSTARDAVRRAVHG